LAPCRTAERRRTEVPEAEDKEASVWLASFSLKQPRLGEHLSKSVGGTLLMAMPTFRQLDAAAITRTLEETGDRIRDRFPESNLRKLAAQLHVISLEAAETEQYLSRPHWPLRIAGSIAIVGLLGLLIVAAVFTVEAPATMTLSDVLQTIEAGVNDMVFFGVAVFFFTTVEVRVKRRRALAMLHQLRSLAHIVDMHQLTKDPERLMAIGAKAEFAVTSSRPTTGIELAKYLDFCSELLSLISKIAALLVQRFDDSLVLAGVNEIEGLTTALSGKIWQKITILERSTGRN
jgi:hypothetical protein